MTSKCTAILLLITFVSCSSKRDKNEYAASALLHNSMMNRSVYIARDLNVLLGDSLPPEVQDSLDVLVQMLDAWKKDVQEVPGNEHHENHSHHDHNHSAAEVTPEQMLLIQKELDSSLSVIARRVTSIRNRHHQPAE